jgi:HAD superfamily hydrolase (TIGR01509 family)
MAMKMEKLKCILFDCDGVLVDSEPIAIQALIDLAKPFGFEMSLAEGISNFSGQSLPYCFDYIEKQIKHTLPIDFEVSYRKFSFEKFKSELQAVNGVKDFIESIQHLDMGVASSGPIDKIELNLNLTQLLPYFKKNIFSCYTIKKWKPAPDIFLYAAKEMGYAIEDCVVIEDSEMGVESALTGGFKTYCYQSNKHKHHHESVQYFEHFHDLKNLISKDYRIV